jgi:hypothetical protein
LEDPGIGRIALKVYDFKGKAGTQGLRMYGSHGNRWRILDSCEPSDFIHIEEILLQFSDYKFIKKDFVSYS